MSRFGGRLTGKFSSSGKKPAEWFSHSLLKYIYRIVDIEDCESWWSSGCYGSVAEHWWLKPEVSWVRLPATAGLFTFLYFRLII